MRLLVDNDIRAALPNPETTALAYQFDQGAPPRRVAINAQLSPASLNLTIGEIFIPASSAQDWGGSSNPKYEHDLAQGHTAVIRTRERLRMGTNRAAIAFPPARDSLRGLLMTNPGHVDPGYEGPLHCTVINMGHSVYPLRQGNIIMRVLFFDLGEAAQATPGTGIGAIPNPITTELLSRLSTDFVDVEKRAKLIADDATSRATWRATLISALIPIGLAIITLATTSYFSPLETIKTDISALKNSLAGDVTKLEEKGDVHDLETNLATLKVQYANQTSFDVRLKAVEDALKKLEVNAPQGQSHQ